MALGQNNWGGNDVSANRNAGLDEAKGKYIFFIDADDFLARDDVLETMIKDLEDNDADFVSGEFDHLLCNDNNRIVGNNRLPKEVPNKINSSKALRFYLGSSVLFVVAWNILFKRELIGDIRFKEDMVVSEDGAFMLDIYKKRPTMYLEKGYVSYIHRSGTPMNSGSKPILKKVFAWEKVAEQGKELVESDYPELHDEMMKHYYAMLQNCLIYLVTSPDKDKKTKKEEKRVYKEIRRKYVSHGKLSKRYVNGKKEKIWDLMIRLNIYRLVYRVLVTMFPKRYKQR